MLAKDRAKQTCRERGQGRTLDSLQAGMGAFLGRSSSSCTREDDADNKRQRTLPALGAADISIQVANEEGILWEQIRQRDRDYTVRRNHISDEFDSTTNNNDGGDDSDSDDEIGEEDYDINGEDGENDEMDYESDIEEIGTPESLNNCVI